MDDEDRRTVSTDGITVEKYVDTARFKTPAVVLEIASTADRTTTVTVMEPIPEAFAIEDIGFHPEFGGNHWSIAGRRITFERDIEPGEQYTTVYGVRDAAEEKIVAFLDAGTSVTTDDGVAVESFDDGGSDAVEELLSEDDADVVRDVIAGERDSLPEMARTSGATDDEGVEATGEATEVEGTESAEDDGDEAVEAGTESAGGGGASGEERPGGAEHGAVGSDEHRTLPGSVAGALAAEIRDGTISEESERVIREAFAEPPEETRGSVDARIEHLQTQVADLSAYTGELERFLDEYGGGDSALAALEEDIANVTESVDTLEDSVDALKQEADGLEENLDGLESEVVETKTDVDALEDRIGNAETRLADAETGIDDLLYLEEDVMALQGRTEDLPELEDRVEELREERVADLDSRLEGLSETIDTLESEMGEMKAFRDRLSSAFGPGGDAGGGGGEDARGDADAE